MSSNHRPQSRVTRRLSTERTPIRATVYLSLPLDREGCYRAGQLPPNEPISTETISLLHHSACHHPSIDIRSELDSAAYDYETDPSTLFLTAIDPATGDSLFHSAIRAQNLAALIDMTREFPPNMSFTIGRKLLFKHKNHRRETILHVASQTGNMDMVIAAYRLFGSGILPGVPTYPGYQPLEDLADLMDDGIPHIMFLLQKDRDGQDAASVARAKGFEDVACWLTSLVSRLDPDEKRNDDAEVNEWTRYMRRYYQHEYTELAAQDPEL